MVITVQEAERDLSSVLDRALAGEEVVITRGDEPVAVLTPLPSATPRRPGGAKGRIFIAEDFDAALPEEVLQGFER